MRAVRRRALPRRAAVRSAGRACTAARRIAAVMLTKGVSVADNDRPRRAQSQTERDMEGLAARREREAVPVPVGEFEQEITGVTERRRKSPSERVERVEDRVDELA